MNPYLPVNPCCTDVVINTPCGCNSTITNNGCNNNDNPCSTNLTLSSNVIYNGPQLECIIAEPCDTLNVVLQKIDEIICNLLSQINILNTQVTNITTQVININSEIIEINNTLGECCGPPTTTTTTTACICTNPSLFKWDVIVTSEDLDASVNSRVYVEFFNCDEELEIITFDTAGTFNEAFCGNVDFYLNQFYFDSEYIEISTIEQPIKGDNCCPQITTTTTTTAAPI